MYSSLKLLIIVLLLLNLIGGIGCAKIYSNFTEAIFSDPTFTFENGWTIADANGNSFLRTDSIFCGQKTSFSVVVNYNAPKSITFDWGIIGTNIGTNANLICYYDNRTDLPYSRICNNYNLAHERIAIPLGHHTVTWKLFVVSCTSDPGSVASIDNINIPESMPEINCTIQTNDKVVIGQESSASLPFSGNDVTYDWQISSGGIIKSPKPYTNRIIWKATKIGETEIKVSVIGRNGTCSNTIKCIVSERDRVIVNCTNYYNENYLI